VAEAIAEGDVDHLREELGDLLLQVVFHARMAEEAGAFSFGDVVEAITGKLIRRHPHVFGDSEARTAGAVKGTWEKIKAEEKRERAARMGTAAPKSVLDGVPAALPALTRATRLQDKAGTVGFDWNDPRAVLAKLREEIDEVEAELDAKAGRDRIEDEIGDLLFAAANLARHLKVDAEQALRRTSAKFTRRFHFIEESLAGAGRRPADADLAEMEALWQEAKRQPGG
jgi:ATP diphosphatase